jgi:hypothetical protein
MPRARGYEVGRPSLTSPQEAPVCAWIGAFSFGGATVTLVVNFLKDT